MSVYFQNSAPPSRTNSFNDEQENEQIMATACNEFGINKSGYGPPTLHSLQLHNSATIAHPPMAADARVKKLEPLEINPLQYKFISDTMGELRERAAKRQRTVGNNRFLQIDHRLMLNNAQHNRVRASVSVHGSDDGSSCDGDDSDRFDILEELDAHPRAIRIVATSGGLITNWNEAFTKITKPPASLQKIPLTIFDLVDSKCLPSLYGMLALALHNIGIVEVEHFSFGDEHRETVLAAGSENEELRRPAASSSSSSSSPSHLSITLPCKLFRSSSTRYNITVIFMNDDASMERCFLGILAPRDRGCNGDGDGDDDGGLGGSSRGSHSSVRASSYSTNGPSPDVVTATRPPRQELPRGRMIRVDDDLLCRVLLGPANGVE